MAWIDGLPPAVTVNPLDYVVICQGSTNGADGQPIPGTGTVTRTTVSSLGGGGGGGSVLSVVGATGDVTAAQLTAGGMAALNSPVLTGNPLATTQSPGDSSTRIATTAFVNAAVAAATSGVISVNAKTGVVVLGVADIAGAAPLSSPNLTGIPLAVTASAGTNSTQIATTAYADTAVAAEATLRTNADNLLAPKNSPNLSGVPIAPTAANGTNTQQLATTAFVQNALSGSTGVSSVNGHVGAVALAVADIPGAAPLASPSLTGVPIAPTASAGTNTTQLSTTAFVNAAVLVETNARTAADVLKANLAGATFTGVAAGLTATPGTNTTQFATTAFVTAAVSAATAGVASVQGLTGTVTAAALATAGFFSGAIGTTQANGTNNTTLATTQFVQNALVAATTGVVSVVGSAGVVSLANLVAGGVAQLASPIFSGFPTTPNNTALANNTNVANTAYVDSAVAVETSARVAAESGFAPLANPIFTGNPQGVTQTAGNNTVSLATTAFVTTAIAAIGSGVTSVGGFSGVVSFAQLETVLAPLNNANLTGNPTAPTPTTGDNDTSIATTQFVTTAVANEATARSSAITTATTGLATLASPTLTGVPKAVTGTPGDNTIMIATNAFVNAAVALAAGAVTSVNTKVGAVVLTVTDIPSAAPLNNPVFTGTPQITTTPTFGDSSTHIADTAFVQAALVPLAPLAGPTFSGVPKAPTAAPTAAAGTTQLATTAFVRNGTTTNDNALAGQVGEFLFSEILQPSAINISANTNTNITTLTLTAGDWEVDGSCLFVPASSTQPNSLSAWFNTTSATPPSGNTIQGYNSHAENPYPVGQPFFILPIPTRRFSLAGTTTLYFSAVTAFTISTMKVGGYVQARRVR